MGWLFKSDEELAEEKEAQQRAEAHEEHNRGQSEGAEASTGGAIFHNVIGHVVHSKEFNDGWDNARKDKWT